jgi:hypothetical protein
MIYVSSGSSPIWLDRDSSVSSDRVDLPTEGDLAKRHGISSANLSSVLMHRPKSGAGHFLYHERAVILHFERRESRESRVAFLRIRTYQKSWLEVRLGGIET